MAQTNITKEYNLYQRINKVMQTVTTVTKGTTVSITQNNSYKAVSHDDVTALLHGPITDAGLVAIPTLTDVALETVAKKTEYNGKITETVSYLVKVWAEVEFINIDKPEERHTVKCYAYALDSGDKAVGKAFSMAVKYVYLKTFMLESSDEEESRDYEKTYYDDSKHYGGGASKPTTYNKPSNTSGSGGCGVGAPVGNVTVKLASEAQLNAVKKLYAGKFSLEELARLTVPEASDLIKNAPKNK